MANSRYDNDIDQEDKDNFFTWEEYLVKRGAKAVPKSAFKHVQDSKSPGFQPGMKVEAKDQSSTSNSYWVATIVMVSGPLLLLRFDGYDDDRTGDFWLNSSSELLQPIGWSAKTDNILIPPVLIRAKRKNWAKFLIENLRNAVAAQDNLFHKNSVDDGPLKVGSKVEIQDSDDPLCYWRANVIEIFGLRLHLRYEGYEPDDKDIWYYYLADHLHNVGWGKRMGLSLKPPKVMDKFPNWSLFRKLVVLCRSRGNAGQAISMGQFSKEGCLVVNSGFKPGMKLETVNPEDPNTICVATVKEIFNKHFFSVEIDSVVGSRPEENPWIICHAKSKDIFPVGWCEKNRFLLTPPKGYRGRFKWNTYLKSMNAEAVPESLFCENNCYRSMSRLAKFDVGSKVEVLDLDDITQYWVAEVVYCFGYKLRLHLEGNTNKKIIMNTYQSSGIINLLGWGKKMGLVLKPPKVLNTAWADEQDMLCQIYQDENEASTSMAMKKLDKKDEFPPIHNFKQYQQLEAVNPKDPSTICAAYVKNIINEHYFIVQLDTLLHLNKDEEDINFWCHANSKNIFPVGWCEKNIIQLTPPPGYPQKELNWNKYMNKLCTTAAPESLFMQTVPRGEFDVGLKLEAVDQTHPQTISIASVTQVVGRTLWVQLDGYQSSSVEHIYDIGSYELFPVGWCSMHGHPMLTPQRRRKDTEKRQLRTTRKRLESSGTSREADSSTKRTTKRQRVESSSTQNAVGAPSKARTSPKEKSKVTASNGIFQEATFSRSTRSASLPTPSSSTGEVSSRQEDEENGEDAEVHDLATDTDTAFETDVSKNQATATIDLTVEDDVRADNDKHIRIFIKSTCSCGPYIEPKKLCSGTEVLGPAEPNIVLRQVVEHVVHCSYSKTKVFDLLATEKDRKSFLSILKTLTSKLSICENLFSLRKIETCSVCDKKKKFNIQEKLKSPCPTRANPSSTTTTLPNSTTKQHAPTKQHAQPTPAKPLTNQKPDPAESTDDDDVMGFIPEGHISTWSIGSVIKFITPRDCKKFADVFKEQEVDGKALMLLSLDDIHKVLSVTLGPAIKLHDDVQKLRRRQR